MDAYPQDYVNHNLPLILLSGLEAGVEDDNGSSVDYPLLAETGPRIFSDFPPLSGAVAEELRSALLEEDGSQKPWRSTVSATGTAPQIKYKIKSIGRVSSLQCSREASCSCIISLINCLRGKQPLPKVHHLQVLLATQIATPQLPAHHTYFTPQSHPCPRALPPSRMDSSLRYG